MKDRRMRMIWNSNAIFVPSGYGVEQRDMLTRFKKDGWPVAQIGFAGLSGANIVLNDIPIYPVMADTWGSDALLYHGNHFKADIRFTMQDVHTLQPQFLQQIKWIPYVPIDQEPVPINVINALKYAYKIITFSQWGQKQLQKMGFVSTLIPEGTDVNIFKPMNKLESKKMLGLPPDSFVVGMVGANKENPPRKGWQQALEAFKLFHDNHPEAVFFYQTNQPMPSGFPIQQFSQHLGIAKQVFHIDDYMAIFQSGSELIAKIMNAFDILIHPSLTEGFGLCVIEAQACGVPVVVNNTCSMPELVIPHETGEICEAGFKWFTNAMGYYNFADTKSLHEKMEVLFKADRVKMGEKARDHVVRNYNIDRIVDTKWIPYFEELQNELLGKLDVKQEKK